MVPELDVHMQKHGIEFTPFTKIKSKWITDLNVKHKIIKLLNNNKGENTRTLGLAMTF